jgi:hypothetical protein
VKVQRTTIILSVIPILLFCLGIIYRTVRGPYYYGYNMDPSYVYLLNSLNIATFQIPGHTDHPGTPLQLLGAVILFIKWLPGCLSAACKSLEESVLLAPEAYLKTLNLFLNSLVALATFFAGIRTIRYCGIVPAITLQFSLLLFFSMQKYLTCFQPEPFMIFLALILTTTLLPEVFGDLPDKPATSGNARAVLTGIIIGVGIATKVTFLPLAGFVMILQGYFKKAIAVSSCVAAVIMTTLPISPYYGRIYNWLESILMHQGKYGKGEVGFPEIGVYLNNLSSLMQRESFIFVLLFVYVVIYISISPAGRLNEYSNKYRVRKLLLVGGLVIMAQIAITAKHPGIQYMVPALAVTPLMNASLMRSYITCRRNEKSYYGAGVVIGLLICAGIISNAENAMSFIQSYETYTANVKEITTKIKEEEGCVVVGYYGASLKTYALSFGDSFANYKHAAKLEQLYPQELHYNLFRDYFKTYDRIIDKATVQFLIDNHNACFLLYGIPIEDRSPNASRNLILKPLIEKGDQALYRLEGIAG